MPGTSHEIEFSILNELPPKKFDAVIHIINFMTLEQIIIMLYNGVDDELKQKYPRINEYEWDTLIKKVCLTRLTAIRIAPYYPRESIKFLLNIALKCMGFNENTPKSTAFSYVKSNQRLLALFLGKCYKLLEKSN